MNQQKGKGTQFFQLQPKEHDPANTSTPDVLLARHDSIICTNIRLMQLKIDLYPKNTHRKID